MTRSTHAHSPLAMALHSLECVAHDVASGRIGNADVGPIVATLHPAVRSGQASSLLAVIAKTAQRLDDGAARRKFFHAARALIAQRRFLFAAA